MEEKIEISKKENFSFFKMHPLAIVVVVVFGILAVWGGSIIGVIISVVCGYYAANHWAPKINGSQTWAFVIPYMFSLIGLFVYWLHYRLTLTSMTKTPPTDTDPKMEDEKS